MKHHLRVTFLNIEYQPNSKVENGVDFICKIHVTNRGQNGYVFSGTISDGNSLRVTISITIGKK